MKMAGVCECGAGLMARQLCPDVQGGLITLDQILPMDVLQVFPIRLDDVLSNSLPLVKVVGGGRWPIRLRQGCKAKGGKELRNE